MMYHYQRAPILGCHMADIREKAADLAARAVSRSLEFHARPASALLFFIVTNDL